MHETIENIIKKNLPETRYELGGYPEEGYYMEVSEDGEYIKSDEINTSLIADEVLKVVESDTRFYSLSPQWIGEDPAWLCILTKGSEVLIEKVLTQKELSSAYYQKTNNYASPVITVDQVDIGGRYILNELLDNLSPNNENKK